MRDCVRLHVFQECLQVAIDGLNLHVFGFASVNASGPFAP